MHCQKALFQLPADLHYINCATMSPLLRSVEAAGIAGVQRKNDPSRIMAIDFFNPLNGPKEKFAQLINAQAMQIAIIPAVSYALANAMNNISCSPGQEALTIAEEFPSDYFALKKWADEQQAKLKVISVDVEEKEKARAWNESIINAITTKTAVVNISAVHWMDGTKFDLKAIGAQCKRVGAKLIVDGTQSVGAMPIDVQACHIDVLICAAYKWLMGPYSIGLAYYHPDFNEGTPIEESWANRDNAMDFSKLANYSAGYMPGAERYCVGEKGNFILLPMLDAALQQILEWQPSNIQQYCAELTRPLMEFAAEQGWPLEEEAYRCAHLFGLRLPPAIDAGNLIKEFKQKKVITSVRGSSMRISPNVYNDSADIAALLDVLKAQVV